jgi:hypothetical protein
MISQLARLGQLRDANLLTEAEFEESQGKNPIWRINGILRKRATHFGRIPLIVHTSHCSCDAKCLFLY